VIQEKETHKMRKLINLCLGSIAVATFTYVLLLFVALGYNVQ